MKTLHLLTTVENTPELQVFNLWRFDLSDFIMTQAGQVGEYVRVQLNFQPLK